MDNNIEGIGEAVTGALAARAVEPMHGEGHEGGERLCANCSTELIGTHCHLCGQKAHIHRTISAIGHDLLHGVLHLDGKFWRTLPLLIFRPGELTRRYVEGERAKFVSPLGMFLFAIFLMFAIFQIYGISLTTLDVSGSGPAARAAMEQSIEATDSQIEELREQRQDLVEAQEEQRPASGSAWDPAGEENARASRIAAIDERIDELTTAREAVDSISSNVREFTIVGDGAPRTGWERLDHGIEKLNENPGLALYKLQANGYKFSWLLIPISVPFVWILFFWTRRFRMYDHTVFVTYSLAFMSLFAIVLTILGFAGLGRPWIIIAAFNVPLLHMYKQLRYGYRLSRFGALVRTVLLANFCFVTATLFFVMLLGIGALG